MIDKLECLTPKYFFPSQIFALTSGTCPNPRVLSDSNTAFDKLECLTLQNIFTIVKTLKQGQELTQHKGANFQICPQSVEMFVRIKRKY